MSHARAAPPHDAVLVDTNAVIEAVRTGTWNAVAGARRVETVEECRDETQRGNPHDPGYVTVEPDHLARLAEVWGVDDEQRAALVLACPRAAGLDPGERDLLAHVLARGDDGWALCSPDIACVRAAVALGMSDRLTALETLADAVGARPRPPLKHHFTRRWLDEQRTRARLGA